MKRGPKLSGKGLPPLIRTMPESKHSFFWEVFPKKENISGTLVLHKLCIFSFAQAVYFQILCSNSWREWFYRFNGLSADRSEHDKGNVVQLSCSCYSSPQAQICTLWLILNHESHYGRELFSLWRVVGQSGSQELDLLKTVAFAGAWLFEEPKRVTELFALWYPIWLFKMPHRAFLLCDTPIWLFKKPRHHF